MAGQIGFWDVEDRLSQLSRHGDPLEKLSVTVDFEMFRADLAKAFPRGDRSKGGRPPFDPVLKFKMLVLQALNGLSLGQTEFLVKDRLSWMRFCGLGPGDAVPDANTLWDFREALIAADALDALFAGSVGIFVCEVGHNGSEGAPRCHDAKNRRSRTASSISCWPAPTRRRPLTPMAFSTS